MLPPCLYWLVKECVLRSYQCRVISMIILNKQKTSDLD